MKHNEYDVTLTNGTTEQTYRIRAMSEEQVIILAQAKAINQARGYKLVSVKLIEDREDKKVYCLSFTDGRLIWN